jgi:uncharacterized protein YndB with AHSA1/START domain
MPRIVFQLDVNAPAETVLAALDSEAGIAGWWTEDVAFAGGAGATMSLGFPIAPLRFEMRVDDASDGGVHWTSIGAFPPHWTGTTVAWTLTQAGDGDVTTVAFNHDGWADDGPLMATAAVTWGQLMLALKSYSETGTGPAVFPKAA